ncbi:MAG: hypothetical protein NTU44_10125 [Bacteroidetes bacterium]|nr:hypothetical protein [Bacteroidota bacterium]
MLKIFAPRETCTRQSPLNCCERFILNYSFRKYVEVHTCPNSAVKASLILAEKDAKASVDGLNQHFFLGSDEEGRKRIQISGEVSPDDLGAKILTEVPDKQELMARIQNVTHPSGSLSGQWSKLPTDKIDQYDLVKRLYYHPATAGSISINIMLNFN